MAEDRRREMREQRQEVRHRAVLLGRLTGKSPQQVPHRRHAQLLAPLEELNVVQTPLALAHDVEHARAEALDARLDDADARVAQQPHLRLLEIGLHFVEQLEVEPARRKRGHEVFEVAVVEDVIHDRDRMTRVAVRESDQLVERALATTCCGTSWSRR